MAQSDHKGRNILNTLLVVLIGQVGCVTLVIVLASVFGGLWLDGLFGTKPLFTRRTNLPRLVNFLDS
jgi:hypothetical protein